MGEHKLPRPMEQREARGDRLLASEVMNIAHPMIDVQVAHLLRVGVPAPVVVTMLLDILTNLLSGVQPVEARSKMVADTIETIQTKTLQKVMDRQRSGAGLIMPGAGGAVAKH